MTRKRLQRLLVAIVAVLSLGSMAEAAGAKRTVRHRVTHSRSTRVARGSTTTGKTTRKKTTRRVRQRRRASAGASTTTGTHKVQPKATAPR